jgi:hypothetical protein
MLSFVCFFWTSMRIDVRSFPLLASEPVRLELAWPRLIITQTAHSKDSFTVFLE